jgi:hypothetical protein
MGLSLFEERYAVTVVGQFLATDTPGDITCLPTLPRLTRIDNVLLTSDDVAAYTVQLVLNDGGGYEAIVATVSIPAGSGTVPGVPSVDLLAGVALRQQALILNPNSYLHLALPGTMTAGSKMTYLIAGGTL